MATDERGRINDPSAPSQSQSSSTNAPPPAAERMEPSCTQGKPCNDCGLCGMRSPRANKRRNKPSLPDADKRKLQNLVPGIDL